jgi:hypothetical protein
MNDMLEVLGVSADDERIYRSLLRQPPSAPWSPAGPSGGGPGTGAKVLEELPHDHVSEPQDYLEIIRGREAVAHRFLQLEQTTQVELLVLDRPPYAQEVTEPNQG